MGDGRGEESITFTHKHRSKPMLKQLLCLLSIIFLFACNPNQEKQQIFEKPDSIQKYGMDSLLLLYNKEHPDAILPLHKEGKYYIAKSVIYHRFSSNPITIEQWYYSRQCVETGFLFVHSGDKTGIIQLPWSSMKDSTRALITLTKDFADIQSKFFRVIDILQSLDELLADNLHLTRVKRLDILPIYKGRYNSIIGCEELCLKNLDKTFDRVSYYLENTVLKTRVYTDGAKFITARVNPKLTPLVKFEVINPECNCKKCD